MRKGLLFILVVGLWLHVGAQELQVFSVNGQAEWQQGKEWKPLVKGQSLKESVRVRTPRQGCLTLLDPARRKVYAVQNEQGGEVAKLVASQRAKSKSLTREAFAAMTRSLFSSQDERYQTRGGVTYRGGNADELLAVWLRAHVDAQYGIQSPSYTLALHAMHTATHKAVRSVRVGETVELLAVNESDVPLWVAVIDVDAEGVWSAVSPQCELLPPHSTVLLPYTVEFFEPRGVDHLLLLAYTEPFDAARVAVLRGSPPAGEAAIEAGAAVMVVIIN